MNAALMCVHQFETTNELRSYRLHANLITVDAGAPLAQQLQRRQVSSHKRLITLQRILVTVSSCLTLPVSHCHKEQEAAFLLFCTLLPFFSCNAGALI
jgi:hypothetical protein